MSSKYVPRQEEAQSGGKAVDGFEIWGVKIVSRSCRRAGRRGDLCEMPQAQSTRGRCTTTELTVHTVLCTYVLSNWSCSRYSTGPNHTPSRTNHTHNLNTSLTQNKQTIRDDKTEESTINTSVQIIRRHMPKMFGTANKTEHMAP